MKNVTLVYGEPGTQALMTPVANGMYNYTIPGDQVTGNMTYYLKAYATTGGEFNTTLYNVSVANFALQPQSNSLIVYRTLTTTSQVLLRSINNFNAQVQLSTAGNPSGLALSFSSNPAKAGTAVNLNASANATVPVGTYPVTLTATYMSAPTSEVVRRTVITVTVTDFLLSVAPLSYAGYGGSTVAFTVTLTLYAGFTHPVNITNISGLPNGASYTLTATNPTILSGSPGTTDLALQIKLPTNTRNGAYPIEISFSGGGITHSLKIQITLL